MIPDLSYRLPDRLEAEKAGPHFSPAPGYGRGSAAPRGGGGGGSAHCRGAESIPACAGEPRACGMGDEPDEVYPRVCGGTMPARPATTIPPGLSPRVRGNPRPERPSLQALGSIPACAGEPPPAGWPRAGTGVYPRVCGGTSPGEPRRAGRAGLSPRVRGNRDRARAVERVRGSIPACAGEPCRSPHRRAAGRVYPRVCGGTSSRFRRRRGASGLSPRVRGNRVRVRLAPQAVGSIPACAGEPSTA